MINPQSLTTECLVCAGLGIWDGNRLVEPYVPPADLGHDGVAHRIYKVLWFRRVRSAGELAALSDAELLKLGGIGATAFKRIRRFVPAPVPTAPAPACGPTPNGLLCTCGRAAGHDRSGAGND